jgi:hypothetical protein
VTDDDARPGADAHEPVGTVGEEAAKLFSALQDWATETGAGAGSSPLHEHLATGSDDCRFCPVCRAIGLVRQTSPEVRTHLASAAGSLLQAVAALMETHVPPERSRAAGVQKIDLDDTAGDESGWDVE